MSKNIENKSLLLEEIFDQWFLNTQITWEKGDSQVLFKLNNEARVGFPYTMVGSNPGKTVAEMDPKFLVFYHCSPGSGIWKPLDLHNLIDQLLTKGEHLKWPRMSRQKLAEIITRSLHTKGERMRLPDYTLGGYWFCFENIFLCVQQDGSWHKEKPNPDYYFRHGLGIKWESNVFFEQMFPGNSGILTEFWWDGKNNSKKWSFRMILSFI